MELNVLIYADDRTATKNYTFTFHAAGAVHDKILDRRVEELTKDGWKIHYRGPVLPENYQLVRDRVAAACATGVLSLDGIIPATLPTQQK
ncbi:MAG TPA: hypothetical protein VJH88_05990 [Candidatus Nanoarchaeia archaeon]|nr:hypothetical protein [Candidatus Nanoarchaeia archaeon]